jgi:PAS domain S-box-containing protein
MGETIKSSSHLLDSIPASFLLTDSHSKILYANRQAESFFGYGREEMTGQRIGILFLGEDLIFFLPNIVYLTRYKSGFEGEALLKQKDGRKIFVHLLTTSFREMGESFLIFVFQEIHRLKALERQKMEVERWASLGRMVEEIAHQFRNPLASIGGFANRLLKKTPSPVQSKSYMNQILQETGRMEKILKQVEEYVRIQRPVFQKEKMQEIVEATITSFHKKAKEKGITIQVDTSSMAGDGELFIDRKLITKVLYHLLENGLEAIDLDPKSKKRGSLQVALHDDGEMVELAIADKGKGISKKNLDLIFEPFFTTQPDRVGLGLTYVRRVLEDLCGKIQVESRLGRGTTIHLSFPKDRRRKVRREWIAPDALPKENS